MQICERQGGGQSRYLRVPISLSPGPPLPHHGFSLHVYRTWLLMNQKAHRYSQIRLDSRHWWGSTAKIASVLSRLQLFLSKMAYSIYCYLTVLTVHSLKPNPSRGAAGTTLGRASSSPPGERIGSLTTYNSIACIYFYIKLVPDSRKRLAIRTRSAVEKPELPD